MTTRLTFYPAILPSASPVAIEAPSAPELPTSGWAARLLHLTGIGALTADSIRAKGPSQEGETALDVKIPTRVIGVQARLDAADRAALWNARAEIARAMVSIPVRFGAELELGRLLIERAGETDLEIYALPRVATIDFIAGSLARAMFEAEWLCPYPYFQETADSTLTVPNTTTAITGDAGTNVITAADHDLAIGDGVKFSGLVGGTGLSAGTVYYIIAGSFTSGAFKVSTSVGGSEVNFTTNITDGTVQKVTTAINAGDVDAPIQALVYGPATEVRLVNETSGESFTVAVTLADGTQWLAVDTTPDVLTIRKYTAVGVWTNAFSGLDLADERLFLLRPGNNLLRLEVAGAGAATVGQIAWRNRYAGHLDMTLDTTTLNAAADTAAGLAAKLALHTADPGSGSANEVGGGGYARADVTWDPASGGISAMTDELTISVPAVSIAWASLWSADGLTRYGKAQLLVSGTPTPANFPVAGVLRILTASLTFTS